MTVGFFHVGRSEVHERLAARLIWSVRAAMPGVRIAHLTDLDTPAMAGADALVRLELTSGKIALQCVEAYAAVHGDWLFVDTDVRIQRDVRCIFDRQFDIAVSDRAGTLLDKELGTKFMAQMPYNKGAVFSRSPTFWSEAVDTLRSMSEKRQNWMGDQDAMNRVIRTCRYRVEVLPNEFNYPPKSKDENLSAKAIIHFKGPRKAWALA